MRLRPPRLVALLLLLALLIAGGIAAAVANGLFLRDSVKTVTVADAIRGFRAGTHTAQGLEGVYVYATRGSESIDALGGAHHPYPAVTTITAERGSCGLQLEWQALDSRSTSWTFCATPAGIELRSYQEVHRFFGRTDHTRYDCRGAVLLPTGGEKAGSRPFSCTTKSGGQQGTTVVLGPERIAVDGTRRDAIHVRTTARVFGANSGTETYDWWLDARDALPLRVVSKARSGRRVILLDIHYREDVVLERSSATPRR